METTRTKNIGTHAKTLTAIFAISILAFAGFFFLHRLQAANPIPIAHAATADYFLKIDGVSGDIQIESFSWGVSRPRDVATGQSSGRRQYQPLIIRKEYDKTSPILYRMAADGKPIKTATLVLMGADGTQGKVVFQDLSIMSFEQKGDMGSPPADSVSFTYQKVTFQ